MPAQWQRRRPPGPPANGLAQPASARLELVPAGPIDVKHDPWQRLIAIASILSVLLVAVGLYVTNDANRETSKANREQQRLTAQGQITDRFTKAIEQLGQPGPDKVDVRLGAIYALQRIMRDSAVDQPAVVDILAAFIRVHAPARSPTVARPARDAPAPPPPPVDIQTALTVLGRRDITHDGERPGPGRVAVDLTHTNLARADLTNADLTNADLGGAELFGADLTNANLTGANLGIANLAYANLTGAHLTANLTGALLIDANLTGADLTANLTDADLSDADLTRADLSYANLNGAILASAKLTDADLTCAHTDDRTRLPYMVIGPAPCG